MEIHVLIQWQLGERFNQGSISESMDFTIHPTYIFYCDFSPEDVIASTETVVILHAQPASDRQPIY